MSFLREPDSVEIGFPTEVQPDTFHQWSAYFRSSKQSLRFNLW